MPGIGHIRRILRLGRPAPAPEPEPAPAPESIRRNTMFSLGMQVTGAVLTGGLTLFLVRALGPDEYGVFALAVATGTVLLLPSDFGISQSAARFIAERRGDAGQTGRILADSIVLKLGISALFSAALIALAVPIAGAYDTDELVWPIRLVALAIFGQSMLGLFAGFFEAMGRNSVGLRLVISESSVEVGASVALVLLGAGAAGAAGGRAIGFGVGAAVGLVLALRLLGRDNVPLRAREQWGFRRIARYGGALFVIDGAFALFAQIDILLIGGILSSAAAGVFAAPMKLLTLLQYPGLALAGGVAPRLAREEGGEPNVAAFQTGIRYLLLLQPLLAAPLLVWADPIVDIVLGSDYAESAEVLRALTPFALLFALGPLLAIGVNYLGEARRRIPLAIGAVAVNAAIDVALLSEIGVVAASIGSDVGMLVYVAGHVWIVAGLVDLDLRGLGLTLLRTLVAFAVMCAVLFAFGTTDVPIALLVGGAVLGSAAYVGALVLIREISRDEVARARGALGRLRARPG